jgi:hypothetical protein
MDAPRPEQASYLVDAERPSKRFHFGAEELGLPCPQRTPVGSLVAPRVIRRIRCHEFRT